MKDAFIYLKSPSFLALLAALAGAYAIYRGVDPERIGAVGAALIGLFRVAGAIDNHAQATKDAAVPSASAPAIPSEALDALAAFATAMTKPAAPTPAALPSDQQKAPAVTS